MVAFRATADHTAPLDIDTNELEAAHWFDREVVQQAARITDRAVMDPAVAAEVHAENPSLSCLIPPRGVIARTLIETWLQETATGHSSGEKMSLTSMRPIILSEKTVF